jgi:hypothetical protein
LPVSAGWRDWSATVIGSNNSQNVGGLVGDNAGSVTGCYAAGSVSGAIDVGGLAGINENTVMDCYATGIVSGYDYLGGLVGWNPSGTITASFWDTQTSGLSYSDGGTGQTTAQMKTLSTFTGAGWDFTNETANGINNIWRMCSNDVNYPRLNWQSMASDMACPDGVAIDDFSAMAAWWLANNCTSSNNDCGRVDMDSSGSVDTADLMIFAANWINSI